MNATLYLFSGLPGTGKSTLARLLAAHAGAVWLRIDTVEQGLRELCGLEVQGEGYRLSYRIARDNLLLGRSVVADCCNPVALTRDEWAQVARDAGADCRRIEIRCSDPEGHRRRVERRPPDVPGLALPTWSEVRSRGYELWSAADVLRIDTAGEDAAQSFARLLARLGERAGG